MARKLITQAQAAETLAVDVTTIRRWLAAGKLDGYKLAGHGVRVDAASLDRILTPIRSA
ncbi:helix-turn-helix domain-containing protein [Rhodococcus sp. IEGM 1330]|uniref:helix-turn-helix domain-containing protein n=1 Tax=Rhodococcus sp. IEGM 1330 TaxID=3082225 RepID=UPI0029547583|nr:helix-turn-helix domain-containing protein [Rhodococcus sp. IEGM 1330]MDV8021019.1 helix-turn-helix domain-containing protein [Rhodococcus sp. IEGM 1330]